MKNNRQSRDKVDKGEEILNSYKDGLLKIASVYLPTTKSKEQVSTQVPTQVPILGSMSRHGSMSNQKIQHSKVNSRRIVLRPAHTSQTDSFPIFHKRSSTVGDDKKWDQGSGGSGSFSSGSGSIADSVHSQLGKYMEIKRIGEGGGKSFFNEMKQQQNLTNKECFEIVDSQLAKQMEIKKIVEGSKSFFNEMKQYQNSINKESLSYIHAYEDLQLNTQPIDLNGQVSIDSNS